MAPAQLPPASDRHLWQIRWVRDLFILAGILLFLWVVYAVRAVTLPALAGLALAYVFNPIVSFAQRRWRVPRWASTLLIMLVALMAVVALVTYLAPLLADQAGQLIHNLPRYAESAADRLSLSIDNLQGSATPAPHAFPDAAAAVDSFAAATQPAAATTRPHLGTFIAQRAGQLDWGQVFDQLLASGRLGVTVVIATVGIVAYLFIAAIVVAFTFFVFSWQFFGVVAWLEQFIPLTHLARTLHILDRMDQAVSAFIRGRLIQATILSVNLTIGWYLAGVPYFLLLGVITGLLNLVPYASFLGLPAAIVLTCASGMSGGGSFHWGLIAWPIVAFLIPQQLDSWVVEPFVQGHATQLSPVVVLLAVLVGASLFGLLGVMLALPTAACLRILAQELLWPRLRAWAAHDPAA